MPINCDTMMTPRNVVRLTKPVRLQAPAVIVFPGSNGNLNASVTIILSFCSGAAVPC